MSTRRHRRSVPEGLPEESHLSRTENRYGMYTLIENVKTANNYDPKRVIRNKQKFYLIAAYINTIFKWKNQLRGLYLNLYLQIILKIEISIK